MFKKILVLIDGQPASMQAIRQGVEVARCNGSEILFFHILPNFNRLPNPTLEAAVPRSVEYEREVRADASKLLRRASSLAEEAGVPSVRSMGSGGSRSEAKWFADVAEKRGCQLIVVATASRNAVVRLMGSSIVPGLISNAKVPVLVCQAEAATAKIGRRTQMKKEAIRRIEIHHQEKNNVHAIHE